MINTTALTEEINKIITNRNLYHNQSRKIAFHLMDANLTFVPLKTLSVDIVRDYQGNIADELSVTCMVTPGTWSDRIFPYINNLEATVILGGTPTLYTRYKAYVKNPVDFRKNNPQFSGVSTYTMDLADAVPIEVQLIPKIITELLPMQCGTIFRNCTMEDALKSFIVNECNKVPGLTDSDMLRGIDMVQADNINVYTNIPIPHDTHILDLPNYLQEKSFGIYQTGLGSYIQDGIWYIYPSFKTKRDDQQVRYINVYVVEKDRYSDIENTWRTEGSDLYIIARLNGESMQAPIANYLNDGNGVRYVNPDVIGTEDHSVVKDNKSIINRSKTVNELFVRDNPNEIKYAKLEIEKSNLNLFERVSRVEALSSTSFSLEWQNSVPRLIKPGAIVRVHYLSERNKVRVIEGVIAKAHHYNHSTREGMFNNGYRTVSALYIITKENIQ